MDNKSKRELIEIASSAYLSGECCSFYEFASNFLLGETVKGVTDSSEFFQSVSAIRNAAKQQRLDTNLKRALGITGKGRTSVILDWSDALLKNGLLQKLSIHELHYTMGYCARLCKIKAEQSWFTDDRNAARQFDRRFMSVAPKPVEKATNTTEYVCPNCHKKVDLGMMLPFATMTRCPDCKKNVKFIP